MVVRDMDELLMEEVLTERAGTVTGAYVFSQDLLEEDFPPVLWQSVSQAIKNASHPMSHHVKKHNRDDDSGLDGARGRDGKCSKCGAVVVTGSALKDGKLRQEAFAKHNKTRK